MSSHPTRLEEIRRQALAEVEKASTSAALHAAKISHLGRKSPLSKLVAELAGVSLEEKRSIGKAANEVRSQIESALSTRMNQVGAEELAARLSAEAIDVTLPGRKPRAGKLHPITQIYDELVDVFVGLGFSPVDGPEVETDWYNFEALNLPPDHPARTMHDTLYVKGKGGQVVFRTHTSPVQIRVMETTPPPVYVIVPGRCARRDTPDPKRSPVFYQIEGLAVDEGISFAHLRGTLEAFARALFGPDQRVRLRPSYFPFTEPSAEVDVLCFKCHGKGCSTCRGEGWIELLGAGMVHPNVFNAAGYPPETTGFAFGLGIERVAMVRFEVPDIRWLYENDLRFLGNF